MKERAGALGAHRLRGSGVYVTKREAWDSERAMTSARQPGRASDNSDAEAALEAQTAPVRRTRARHLAYSELYSPVKRNSACHGLSECTTSQWRFAMFSGSNAVPATI